MISLIPLALLALAAIATLLIERNAEEETEQECQHPWYMDGRCILCGTPR